MYNHAASNFLLLGLFASGVAIFKSEVEGRRDYASKNKLYGSLGHSESNEGYL